VSNIKITTNSGSNISIAVKPSTSVSVKQGSQPAVSIKGVVGAVHDLTGTDFGFLYKSGDNKISTSAITYDVNSQKVTFPGGISPLSIYDQNDSRGTSGQILSSTGTALDWINLTEIQGVDGTGTANYVAKWTDGDTITNSTIYDDGTNVGIGTTSPAYKLDVDSTSNTARLKVGGTSYGNTALLLENPNGSTTNPGGVSFRMVSGAFNAQFEAYHKATSSGQGVAQFGTYDTNSRVALYAGNTQQQLENSFYKLIVNSNTAAYVSSSGNVGIGTID
jgi:hypothetical protein